MGTPEGSNSTPVNTEVINYPLVNTEETDIRPFIPPCHDALPLYLYYEKHQIGHLWDPSRGLETAGKVVGFALDDDFFRQALETHLSSPAHALPWFFSPFISANATMMAVNRGKTARRPQSVLQIHLNKSLNEHDGVRSDPQPYIYSLRTLVMEFKIQVSNKRTGSIRNLST